MTEETNPEEYDWESSDTSLENTDESGNDVTGGDDNGK